MASTKAEQAVRQYLLHIAEGPVKIDGRSKDPLNRLAALAAAERATEAEAGFVEHAKAYAEAESIPAAAWREIGVSELVLRRARLISGQGRSATGSPGKPVTKKAADKKRKARVNLTAEGLLAKLPKGNFTKADATKLGKASAATTDARLKELVKSRKLKVVRKGGRGRGSATVYAKP